jgi:hypothetical protein
MELAHGYTEETEDGITWRIDRQPLIINSLPEENEDEIENEEIDTEHFWAFNPRQEVQEQLDHNVWRSLYKHPIQLNILIDVLCTETIEELDAIEECGICYEPVKLLDTALLGCCHKFCVNCIDTYLTTMKKHKVPCCAFCRAPIESLVVKNTEMLQRLDRHICFI